MSNMHSQESIANPIINEQLLRKRIKASLDENSLTQVWLINRLSERGLTTEKTEFSSILSGTRRGAKVSALLKASDEILSKYERTMANDP